MFVVLHSIVALWVVIAWATRLIYATGSKKITPSLQPVSRWLKSAMPLLLSPNALANRTTRRTQG
jgi:hypothetical protein